MTYVQLIAYIDGLYADGSLSDQDYQNIINYIIAGGNLENAPRDLIQIRRGNKVDLPILAQGELAITLDTQDLHGGGLDGNINLSAQSFINVRKFGAKGDGVTDDTDAVRSAINHVLSLNGGVLFFPTGVYITKKLTIYNEMFFVGEGRGNSIIKLKDGANENLIEGYQSGTLWDTNSTGGLTHYGLKDIELDGNNTNNTSGSCLAVYGQEPYILNVSIKNSPEYGRDASYSRGNE